MLPSFLPSFQNQDEKTCMHVCVEKRKRRTAHLEVSSTEVLVLMNVQPEIQGILVPFPLKEDL